MEAYACSLLLLQDSQEEVVTLYQGDIPSPEPHKPSVNVPPNLRNQPPTLRRATLEFAMDPNRWLLRSFLLVLVPQKKVIFLMLARRNVAFAWPREMHSSPCRLIGAAVRHSTLPVALEAMRPVNYRLQCFDKRISRAHHVEQCLPICRSAVLQ